MIHTQPFERFLFGQIKAELAKIGWTLNAKRFDINLFQISATAKDITLVGPGIDVKLELAEINASAGIVTGKLSFDEILVAKGVIAIVPQTTPQDSSPPAQLMLPEIHLGSANLEQITLRINESTQSLDLRVRDLNLAYQASLLKAGLTTRATTIANRKLPDIQWQLQLHTESFQEFDDIHLSMKAPESRLEIKGSVDILLNPNLSLRATLGKDLLPEQPGLVVEARLDSIEAWAKLNGQVTILDQTKTWQVETLFPYRVRPIRAPIQLQLQDLLDGSIVATLDGDSYRGEYQFHGEPEGINRLFPQLKLTQANLEGTFMGNTKDLGSTTADGLLMLRGAPQIDATMKFAENIISLKGIAKPVKEAAIVFDAQLGEELIVSVNGQLPSLSALDSYWERPTNITTGGIQFQAKIQGELKNLKLESGQIVANQVSLDRYLNDDFELLLSGPIQALKGQLYGAKLNQSAPFLTFELDAEKKHWQQLTLQINSQHLALDDYHYNLVARGQGSGPLVSPHVSGTLRSAFFKEGAALGWIAFDSIYSNDRLQINNLKAETHHGALEGKGKLNLSSFAWETELSFLSKKNSEWTAIFDQELPEFAFHLEGTDAGLEGRVSLPKQNLSIGELSFPLQANQSLRIQAKPTLENALATWPEFELAGLVFTNLEIEFVESKIKAKSQFATKDIEQLKALAGSVWPTDLQVASLNGSASFSTDMEFKDLFANLQLAELKGAFRGEPLEVQDMSIDMTPSALTVDPTSFSFADATIRVRSKTLAELTSDPSETKAPINLLLSLETTKQDRLKDLFKTEWPEGFQLESFAATVSLQSDWGFEKPEIDFQIDELSAMYNEQGISTQGLKGSFDGQLWLAPGNVQVGDLDVEITNQGKGFEIRAQPDIAFLAQWVPELVGNAQFDLLLTWVPTNQGFTATFSQKSGRLIYPEPWMEVEDLSLIFRQEDEHLFALSSKSGLVNGKPFNLNASMDFSSDTPDITFLGDIEGLPLAFADYQFQLTTVLEWRLNADQNQLTGTLAIKDGYLSPKIAVEGLVQELLAPIPAIYFPDPILEKVRLHLTILTESPAVVDHELGYWELETPALIIGGNLAGPVPISGSLNINEGSVLRQGRNTFLFKNSQIQFHPNRIGDPYLQIVMVEAVNGEEKNPIYFTGYVTEFSQNVSSKDITSFLLTIALGRVTSLVSFEIQTADSLLDNSFTTWISRKLTDKVVVRYAIPLNDQEQLLEVKVGPFRKNFLNIAETENRYFGSIRHAQKFGYLESMPETIKKVIFTGDPLPKAVRKRFKLEKGDVYTQTRMRFSEFDLIRRLKRRGFLTSRVTHDYTDQQLTVHIDAGKQWSMEINGLSLTQEDKESLFLDMRGDSETSARHLELLVERLALKKGHPSAAAFASFSDQALNVDVFTGFPIKDVRIDFGEANTILGSQYQSKDESRRLAIKYFVSPKDAENEVRARLAAKGYVRPKFGKADFPTPDTFKMPITLGPRADLFFIVVNGEPWESSLVGKPFEFGFMAETVKTLSQPKAGQRYLVKLTPRLDGDDIFFDVIKKPLEDNTIDELEVKGTGRISEDTIRGFLNFRSPMLQTKLMRNQEKLIETGLFKLARLRTTGKAALLEVNERNRWDVDYELSYDEVNELGTGIQFRDRMLFKGFNPLAVAVRRNRVEEEFVTRQQFLHVFGTPLDLFVGVTWNNERIDLNPDQSDPLFGTVFITRRPRERTELNAGLSLKPTEHQLLTAGLTWERIITRQFEEGFFFDDDGVLIPDPTVPPVRLADSKLNRVPIRTSWLFSNLDNEIYPTHGIFSQVSLEYFPRALGTNDILSGWRLLTKFNNFYTWGRLRWWQRIEAGLYERELTTSSVLEDQADTNLFLLGGPKSIRGFKYQLVGPLDLGVENKLTPLGGQAMTIFTQELNYDLNFLGMGLSPFVDGGWVWRNREDFLSDDLIITGGLGLTFQTPVGNIRVDWATPLNDQTFETQLQRLFGTDPEALRRAREQAISEFSIRFGRVF